MVWDGDCRVGAVEPQGCGARAFSSVDREAPGTYETPDSVWIGSRFPGSWVEREFAAEDGQAQASVTLDIPLVDDPSGKHEDETPAGAKVPEPTTLVLLGAGMITMSRSARAKRQQRKPAQHVSRLVSTYQQGCR